MTRQNKWNPMGLRHDHRGVLRDRYGRVMTVDWDEFERKRRKPGTPLKSPKVLNPLHAATKLAEAVLEGESAKEFLKKIGRPALVPFTVDIPEWDDLEDWQKWAFKDMALLIDAGWEPADPDAPGGTLTTELAVDSSDDDSMRISYGREEWYVYRDHDAATAAARERAKSALEDNIFSQEFLTRFINTDRLRRDLSSDVSNSEEENFRQDYRSDEKRRDKLVEEGYLEESDFFTEDGDELDLTPELEAKIESAAEEYIEKQTEKALEDPVQYLQDIFGEADGLKQAIEIGGINEDAVAEAAVEEDIGQWLSAYDGNTSELDHGALAFRHN